MNKYFLNLMSRLLHSKIHQVMCYFWVFIVNLFYFLWSIFFSRKLCFLWSLYFTLIVESVNLDTSSKPTLGFFLKIAFSSWIILLISLHDHNSIHWSLKSWWWILLKGFIFYCCEIILIRQKPLEVFGEFIWILFFDYYYEC